MNGRQIDTVLKSFQKSRGVYRGVFSSNLLPLQKKIKVPAAFVVNLSPSYEIGSHWIAIYIDNNRIGYYFDSYGLPPNVPKIKRFLQKQCKLFYHSHAELQSTNSSVCGAYAICFIVFMLQNRSLKKFESYFCTNQYINDYCIKKTLDKIKELTFNR